MANNLGESYTKDQPLIRQLRDQTGLSQSEFAKKFHIPVKSIQAWEHGESVPRVYITYMIGRILDLEDQVEKVKGELI